MRVIVSSAVLIGSAAAAVFTAVLLIRPEARATNTVVVVPPAPPTFTADQVAAAKKTACDAWSTASTVMANASNAVGDTPNGWDNAATKDAVAFAARTTLVESTYLRGRIGPATPLEVSGPIHDYLVGVFDQQEANIRQTGSQADAAVDRINAAVDRVNAACGPK